MVQAGTCLLVEFCNACSLITFQYKCYNVIHLAPFLLNTSELHVLDLVIGKVYIKAPLLTMCMID